MGGPYSPTLHIGRSMVKLYGETGGTRDGSPPVADPGQPTPWSSNLPAAQPSDLHLGTVNPIVATFGTKRFDI